VPWTVGSLAVAATARFGVAEAVVRRERQERLRGR
jgi:hypothetical protein